MVAESSLPKRRANLYGASLELPASWVDISRHIFQVHGSPIVSVEFLAFDVLTKSDAENAFVQFCQNAESATEPFSSRPIRQVAHASLEVRDFEMQVLAEAELVPAPYIEDSAPPVNHFRIAMVHGPGRVLFITAQATRDADSTWDAFLGSFRFAPFEASNALSRRYRLAEFIAEFPGPVETPRVLRFQSPALTHLLKLEWLERPSLLQMPRLDDLFAPQEGELRTFQERLVNSAFGGLNPDRRTWVSKSSAVNAPQVFGAVACERTHARVLELEYAAQGDAADASDVWDHLLSSLKVEV